jgi:hypothetical protein
MLPAGCLKYSRLVAPERFTALFIRRVPIELEEPLNSTDRTPAEPEKIWELFVTNVAAGSKLAVLPIVNVPYEIVVPP